MGKKQMTALIIAVVSFAAFFYYGFLSFSTESPFVNLFSFVGLMVGTITSLFIGNSGAR